MSKNKKAQFDVARKSIYWLLIMFVITIVVIAVAYLFAGYRAKMTQIPPELKAELVSLRFTNNADCFAYQDPETKKTFSGTIGLEKFTRERMDLCYLTEPEKGYEEYNFGLELKNQKKSLQTNNYFHKDDFTLLKSVRVWDGKTFVPDTLILYVQEKI